MPVADTAACPAWFAALDEDDQAQCRLELAHAAPAGDEHPGKLEAALAAWKASGEALSDPVAREVLTAAEFREDDFTEAAPPLPPSIYGRIEMPELSRLMAVAADAYRDGLREGRHDAARRLLGTVVVSKACGSGLIATERIRQRVGEGYAAEHDAEHAQGELAKAAAAYALAPYGYASARRTVWPRGWQFKRASPVRMLVKAGALIAAEIDRLLAAGEESQ